MRVLLVNPPVLTVQETFYDAPPYPRTGLAYLAGSLRAAAIDVAVMDCKYDRINYQEALSQIVGTPPSVLAITAMTNEIIQANELAMAVKKALPQTVTIIGGTHVSVLPERTLREFPVFDFAVVGEGEITLPELIAAIDHHRPPMDIRGVACLDQDGSYRYGGDRARCIDLDELPEPAWDLFRPSNEYIVHSQRGCPFGCPFCANPNGTKIRAESIDRTMRQAEYLYERGCRTMNFGDEVFTLNRERAIGICRRFIESGLHKKMRWGAATHINCIDYELACLMREAGCYLVGLGLESGDEGRLKEIGKSTSRERIISVVSQIKRARLPVAGYFILGQPNESRQTARATIDLAVLTNPDYPVFGIMVPYPGTEVGRMAENGEGGYRLCAKSWDDYNKQIGNALDFQGIARAELERMQMQGYIEVFLRNLRFADFIRFCWKYRTVGWTLCKRMVSGKPKQQA